MITRRFEKILEPYRIAQVKTKNRIVKTGAQMVFDDRNADIGERHIAFYERLARGGVGLIIVESTSVEYPLGIRRPPQSHIEDDKYIPNYAKLTQAIHRHGCPTFLQLFHAGPWHQSKFSGLQPVSSSSLTESECEKLGVEVPRELTLYEIGDLIEKFTRAAERAQQAGFDGIELNAGTCHLLNSFLSRVWNKRKDVYGCGDLDNRARFIVEITREIKNRLGKDFPVSILINGAEYGIHKGITSEESKEIAQILQDAGADAIQVRAFGYGDYFPMLFPEQVYYPEPPKPLVRELDWTRRGAGALVPLAAAIKKVVSIPVITVGRLDPILGEKTLRQKKADFIGFTRRLLADPELPNKIASGRLEDIAPCTACLSCADAVVFRREPVRCQVNATLGREREYGFNQEEGERKKVLVVGGGPAGMEAARVAALRGNDVTLYEKEHKLGGLLPLAALVKGFERENLMTLIHYLKTQITKAGVKVKLGKDVDLSLLKQVKPDVVILAAGGISALPRISGINMDNVVKNSDLHRLLRNYLRFLSPRFLRWLTRFWMPLGKKLLIVGGAIQGSELAEFLIKRGRRVTIVDTAEKLGEGMVEETKRRLLKWLSERGVTMVTGVKYDEVTGRGLIITTKEGQKRTIEADTIVFALPLHPKTELFTNLEGEVPEIYPVGDCRNPGLIVDAISDGSRVAHKVSNAKCS